MLIEREIALFQAFAVPAKRARYAELLRTGKGRKKLLAGLYHFADLDPRYCRKIPSSEHTPSAISKLLHRLGAPRFCYVISTDNDVDGKELELDLALDRIMSRGDGTFICCISGRLAYFEGEDISARYVCCK